MCSRSRRVRSDAITAIYLIVIESEFSEKWIPLVGPMLSDRPAPAPGGASGGYRDLEHAVALVREQIIGVLDPLQREAMRYQRREIDPA